MWAVNPDDYEKSWAKIKQLGVEAIDQGAESVDITAWTEASSAHLAVLVFWWQIAKSRNRVLKITGMNPAFKTLAELGGVSCIETGEPDAGH